MLRALVCSAFIPSPPRTFSDSVGFTPVFAPLGTVYQRLGPLPPLVRGCAHHRAALEMAQDLVASQSLCRATVHDLSTLPIQTYDRAMVLDARLSPGGFEPRIHHSASIGHCFDLSSCRLRRQSTS